MHGPRSCWSWCVLEPITFAFWRIGAMNPYWFAASPRNPCGFRRSSDGLRFGMRRFICGVGLGVRIFVRGVGGLAYRAGPEARSFLGEVHAELDA